MRGDEWEGGGGRGGRAGGRAAGKGKMQCHLRGSTPRPGEGYYDATTRPERHAHTQHALVAMASLTYELAAIAASSVSALARAGGDVTGTAGTTLGAAIKGSASDGWVSPCAAISNPPTRLRSEGASRLPGRVWFAPRGLRGCGATGGVTTLQRNPRWESPKTLPAPHRLQALRVCASTRPRPPLERFQLAVPLSSLAASRTRAPAQGPVLHRCPL